MIEATLTIKVGDKEIHYRDITIPEEGVVVFNFNGFLNEFRRLLKKNIPVSPSNTP